MKTESANQEEVLKLTHQNGGFEDHFHDVSDSGSATSNGPYSVTSLKDNEAKLESIGLLGFILCLIAIGVTTIFTIQAGVELFWGAIP